MYSVKDGHNILEKAWSGDGKAINSGDFDGLDVATFKEKITAWLEAKELGRRKSTD